MMVRSQMNGRLNLRGTHHQFRPGRAVELIDIVSILSSACILIDYLRCIILEYITCYSKCRVNSLLHCIHITMPYREDHFST